MTPAANVQARGLLPAMPPRRTPWLAVTGAKGGVGKTVIAVNLALQLARAGYRTLLVDLDPGLGNVDVQLRLQSRFSLEDVALGACSREQALVQGPAGLQVLCGRSGSTALAGGDVAFLASVLATVDGIARDFDVVVADTGAGIGPCVLAVAERADLVLAVTTPEPASLTDTYALGKLLHHRGRALPRLIVNRVRSRDEAMRTAAKLTSVCRKFLAADCQLLGWLTRDSLLELSVVEQRPFALHGTGPALEDLRGICAATLAALPPVARRQRAVPAPRVVRLRPHHC